jgi:hypothetical protein
MSVFHNISLNEKNNLMVVLVCMIFYFVCKLNVKLELFNVFMGSSL